MKLISQSLLAEFDSGLQLIQSSIHNPVLQTEQAIKSSITVLEKLKTACLKYTFQNKAEEIEFFRNIKPQFASKLIYHNELYTIQTNIPFGSVKQIRKYYQTELGKLETYYGENKDFYRYYRTANNSLDKKYFVRGKFDFRLTLDSLYFQADHRFSTSHDYSVARILANDALKVYLDNEINKLTNKDNPQMEIQQNCNTLKWTSSKVALVELVYALQTEGVFNNGNSELTEIAAVLQSVFNIDLGQFNRIFLEIRARKSDRTKFLNGLKEKLIIRMDDADENQ